MSMPKGYKVKGGYATVADDLGIGYREIADEMTAAGYKMNHSTARNVFVTGLMKIAEGITEMHGESMTQKDIKNIAIDPRFQEAVSEYMKEIEYDQLQKSNK